MGPTLCSFSYLNVLTMHSHVLKHSCQLSQYGQYTHDIMAYVPIRPVASNFELVRPGSGCGFGQEVGVVSYHKMSFNIRN